jgi:superfamily II DNA/RNA helicase
LTEILQLNDPSTAPAEPHVHVEQADETRPCHAADEAVTPVESDVAAEAGAEIAASEGAADEGVAAPDVEEAAAAPDAEEAAASPGEDEAEAEAPVSGFRELGLSEPILRAVTEKGYLTPTPIQAQAIPFVLMGRDVLGCAQTGTGKTASFTLPMIDILSGSRARARMPRSLILEPTRELALQVAENFVEYGKYLKLTHALVIGGESMSDQKDLLMRGVDVLIATPGRLIDMFERGAILLTDTKVLVIDEADRMLDMGFIPDVERIVAMLPANRQTLFFSATMAPEIRRLADAFLQNPKTITVSKPASVATTITEGLVLVKETDKREALRRLIRSEDVQNALIFCNRKRDVDILFKSLTRHGFSVGALHGDMAQAVRFTTLEKFKAGELRLLCCSDVAARGIDIGGLSHVFNFDVPHHAEDYVHRIGRTGRAGREGRAFSLATGEDRLAVEAIEKLTGHAIPRIAIDGLDVIDWAESDGRKRGRGRGKAAPRKDEPKRSEAKEAAPKDEAPKDGARAGRGRRGAKPEHAAAEPVVVSQDVQHQPESAARPERGPRRDDRRDDRGRNRRDDDLGPAVIGFGDDVPAFMLIAARPRRHEMHDAHAEETES